MRDRYADDDLPICTVGGHRHRGTGRLCEHHLAGVRGWLTRLPDLVRQLGLYLVPGPALPGAKVSTSRLGSPTPARLDVLSLIGPGTTEVRRDRRLLVPQVRRWSTVETVTVHSVRAGRPVRERRQVRTWHRELVVDRGGRPVLVLDDDQVGTVPPAEWADLWVRRWRRELEHAVPRRSTNGGYRPRWLPGGKQSPVPATLPAVNRVAETRTQRLADAAVREQMLMAAGRPHLMPAVAAYVAAGAIVKQIMIDTQMRVRHAVLGLRDDGDTARARVASALAGEHVDRLPHDAIAAEWIVRYGAATTAATVEVDAGYLAQWLPFIAELPGEPGDQVAGFAAELRALVAELEHVLGETRDEQWLGRCPTKLINDDGEETGRLCGAGLWQDPYRTRIECPRCHTVTPPADWVALAIRIKHLWPVDQRRRYTDGDRRAAELNVDHLPTCRGCERTLTIEWREVTTRRDTGRVWRPVRLACPTGCLAGGTQVAA